MIGIYKITSPTKKVYIGQSIDIEKRFQKYKNLKCKSQRRLYRSLLKYGYEKHKIEIIHECEREKLNELEVYYIELYQCFNSEYGLNLMGGGNGKMHSDETKKIFSKLKKNNKYRLGMITSEETKLKMSLAQKGKKLSEEHKKKISKANKGKVSQLIGRKLSEEHKSKISKSKKYCISNRKGLKLSENTKRKIGLANRGKKLNKITRKYE